MPEEAEGKPVSKRRRFLLDAVKGGLPLLASIWAGEKIGAPAEPAPAAVEPELPKPQVPADLKHELDESYEEFARSNPDYFQEE